jgi:hypothetical protein
MPLGIVWFSRGHCHTTPATTSLPIEMYVDMTVYIESYQLTGGLNLKGTPDPCGLVTFLTVQTVMFTLYPTITYLLFCTK